MSGDFYGATHYGLVQGLEDVAKYPDLFAELVRRGWSDDDLVKLSRDNLIRVLTGVEEAAGRLQKKRAPSIKTIEELDGESGS